MKSFIACLCLSSFLFSASSCAPADDGDGFVSVVDGVFKSGEESPLYYIGTNFWYGPILASDTEYGDNARLTAELDTLKHLGIENLRVLVGVDGSYGTDVKVQPALQTAPGVYDEKLLEGLDRFMAELGKRNMKAVLYLTNSWEWSGGFGQYLEWAGEGDVVLPVRDGWNPFTEYTSRFMFNEKAKSMLADHIRKIVSRVNTVTGRPYSEDPAIFSWQIANEPRCFSSSPENKKAFADWVWSTAALIKSLDQNHMVSTGSEGYYGCEFDMDLFEKIHSCPDVDYLNMHIWPYNWKWVGKETLESGLDEAIAKTDKYIDAHIEVAERCGKPIVLEEFGWPRDGVSYSKEAPVTVKNRYYRYVLERVVKAKKEGSKLAGANFWGWGGYAEQTDGRVNWIPGDDYCCDPAHEPQGLYSVYLSDRSTIEVIMDVQKQLEDVALSLK